MQATLITLSAAFLLAGPRAASVDQTSSQSYVVPRGLITWIDAVSLPTQEAGVLKKLGTPL